MKALISILFVMMIVGCVKQEVAVVEGEPEQRKLTAAEESVIGSYEGGDSIKLVFLKNGVVEFYEDGEKDSERERKWRIAGKEVHTVAPSTGTIGVFRIEPNGDLTPIARINDSKREEAPKEHQLPFKKLK